LAANLNRLAEKLIYPAGFAQQDPAYQVAWLDQRIPELEGKIAGLELQTAPSKSAANAKAQTPRKLTDYLEGKVDIDELAARQDLTRLNLLRQQLMDVKARRAAVAALLPVPAAPTLTRAELCRAKRDEIDAKIAQVNADSDDRLKRIADPLRRRQIENSRDDAVHQLEQERTKWLY
jgi:TolA-binding protein